MRLITISIFLSVVLGISGIGNAEAQSGMTEITSDQLTYDYRRSIAIFEDNVVAVDPQVRIESDTLTVLFGSTNEIKSVTALGNVKIRSEGKTAECRKAIYIAATGEILLTGNAKLTRANDSVMGDQITFWLNEERVLCKPGHLVIYPDKERSGGDLLGDQLQGPSPGGSGD